MNRRLRLLGLLAAVLTCAARPAAGDPPAPAWAVTPLSIDFGLVGVGLQSPWRAVTVRNDGDGTGTLDVRLDDPDGVFKALPSGTTFQPVIEPGQARTFAVAYAPDAAGVHAGALLLGGGAPAVPLAGRAEPPRPRCALDADELDFGRVPVGGRGRKVFRVENTGTGTMTLAPAFTPAGAPLEVTDHPDELAPGEDGWCTVVFTPTAAGPVTAALDLGPDACAPLAVRGEGVAGARDENQVVVSFAPDRVVRQAFVDAPGEPVPAYLMLTNPTFDAGVFGWELRLAASSGMELVSVRPRGRAANFAEPPEFVVGLADPLPAGPVVVLADLLLLPRTTEPTALAVLPVGTPSLPGLLAWAYDSDYELIAARPWGDDPLVAWLNPMQGATGLAPAPTVRRHGGRVVLRWSLPPGAADACHVYRTVDGRETRLTAEPLAPAGGAFVFTDRLAGVPAGAETAYRYGLVKQGAEIARSPAAAVRLPAAPAATRLLPNRPNPFNPETEIRFELRRSGRVRLAVYDVAGRRVATLLDGLREAGPHRLAWRGRDAAGRLLPSGTYYLHLETDDARDTRKMMLLK